MNDKFPAANSPLFRYLLRELTPEEESQIESRLLIDDDYKMQLEAAEDDLTNAFVREGLTEDKRERYVKFFLCSEERVEKLKTAEKWYKYAKQSQVIESADANWSNWLPNHLSLPTVPTLVALLIIGLSALIMMLFYSRLATAWGLNALNAAYAQARPIEPRISGFTYAQYFVGQDGEAPKFDRSEHDRAFGIITNQASVNKNSASYHALGKLYITERRFSDAVDYLELALKDDAGNAKLHNDLAVALMAKERAKKSGEATGEDLAEALEHLHRAIELNTSFLEAHFNLALCHQYQMLWRTAQEDWRSYLEKDSQSPWAEEARKNLGKVEAQIKKAGENQEQLQSKFRDAYQKREVEQAWQAFKSSRLSTGSFITNKLIDEYLSLMLSGKSTEAGDKLQALLFIGSMELDKFGERYNYDLAQFYQGTTLPQLQRLSEAREVVRAASGLFDRSLFDQAANKYQQARDLFNRLGDTVEALAAQRRLGHCYFRLANTKLSLSTLTQGSQDCENRSYIWLLGMYHNDLVNVNLDLTKYSIALDHSQRMIDCSRRIEDEHGIRRGLSRVLDIYTLLSRYRESLLVAQEGLLLAAKIYGAPDQIIGSYVNASQSYLGLGKLMAALDYQKEALALSLELNRPLLISRQYILLGRVYDKLNNHAEAIKLMQQSVEIGKNLPDAKTGREITAFAKLFLGQVYRGIGDFNQAVKSYTESLQLYNENDLDSPLMGFMAKKGVLLSHIQQGHDAAAEEELKQILDIYEEHRRNIDDEASRNSFFDHEQGIYDIAIEFSYFKQRKDRRAFDYSELSRARSLLDTVDLPPARLPEGNLPSIRLPRSIQPFDLDQIQARIPDGTCLLQYAVLDDKLIIWMVSGRELQSRSVDITQDELSRKVNDYLQLLEKGASTQKSVDHRALASELYNLLIKPVESVLPRNTEVCIIPDKILNRLPFASLISPASGKYLIQERMIYISPSANMFLVSTDKARQKEGVTSETLLSVGNPWFDRGAFRNLKDIPWATDQAAKIATFYQLPTVLLEGDAREGAIRRMLERADVAHFAMHYIADERSPLLSLLPLAEEKLPTSKDRDGVLQTYEFYQMNLSRLRLVVLSACQTGIERYYKGEGAIGLARAFQGAGIPLVVASLWPVESYPTKELMVRFHQHRKRDGQPTAEALRQAQLDMINSSSAELRNPYHWAAYTVIGGHAKF